MILIQTEVLHLELSPQLDHWHQQRVWPHIIPPAELSQSLLYLISSVMELPQSLVNMERCPFMPAMASIHPRCFLVYVVWTPSKVVLVAWPTLFVGIAEKLS